MTWSDRLFPRELWPARYTSVDLRKDLLGGLIAAFVLFPLSIGYGLISGLGAVAGLYGGIALSLVGAVCGGVAAVVRGPNILIATAMAFLVAEYVTSAVVISQLVVNAALAGGRKTIVIVGPRPEVHRTLSPATASFGQRYPRCRGRCSPAGSASNRGGTAQHWLRHLFLKP